MLFVSVLLHELGHSVVALPYGIPVRSIAFAWNPQTSVLLARRSARESVSAKHAKKPLDLMRPAAHDTSRKRGIRSFGLGFARSQ
jgi:Zn-dependent protease